MKSIKKSVFISLAGAALILSGAVAQASYPGDVGVPNPMVEYSSYDDLDNALGFEPLFLTKSFGYKCDAFYSISGKTADIRYTNDQGAEVTVRTARLVPEESNDISGVYTGKWKEKTIGNTPLKVAKLSKDSFAASWTEDAFAFSLTGDHMTEEEFMKLLGGYFVDITEHFYTIRDLTK